MDSDGMCTVVACKDGSLRLLSSSLKGFVQASAPGYGLIPWVALDVPLARWLHPPPGYFPMQQCPLGWFIVAIHTSASKRRNDRWIVGSVIALRICITAFPRVLSWTNAHFRAGDIFHSPRHTPGQR